METTTLPKCHTCKLIKELENKLQKKIETFPLVHKKIKYSDTIKMPIREMSPTLALDIGYIQGMKHALSIIKNTN